FSFFFFFFQAEDGIRDFHVTGVQTCALPISCAFAEGPGRERLGVAWKSAIRLRARGGARSAFEAAADRRAFGRFVDMMQRTPPRLSWLSSSLSAIQVLILKTRGTRW